MSAKVYRIHRALLVAHLCLVFTLAWAFLLSPWICHRIAIKEQQALYRYVVEHESFNQLPSGQQTAIQARSWILSDSGSAPWALLIEGLRHLAFRLSPYLRAFLFLSILLGLLTLRGTCGAAHTLWLLPLLLLCEALSPNNALDGEEKGLYPSESYLIAHYLPAPPSGSASDQQDQLRMAWERYLLKEWDSSGIEMAGLRFHCARLLGPTQGGAPRRLGPLMMLAVCTWTILLVLSLYLIGAVTWRRANLEARRGG